jgi:hypothetical protein
VQGFDVVLYDVVLEIEVDVRVVLNVEVYSRVVVEVDFRVALEVDVDVRVVLDVKVVLEVHVIQELMLVQGVEIICRGFVVMTVVHDVVVVLVCGWGGGSIVELEVQGVNVLGGGDGRRGIQIELLVHRVVDDGCGGGAGTDLELVVHGVDVGGGGGGV